MWAYLLLLAENRLAMPCCLLAVARLKWSRSASLATRGAVLCYVARDDGAVRVRPSLGPRSNFAQTLILGAQSLRRDKHESQEVAHLLGNEEERAHSLQEL